MSVQSVAEGQDAFRRARQENDTLYAVIKTVSSSLDLDRVLLGIVNIATDATGCHACFIYFLKRERLVLEAASPRYAHLVGELEWGIDEGLTGWVARTRTPEFIRERAMEDRRMKYVPELEEESFHAPDRRGSEVDVDGEFVRKRLAPMMGREDLSKYVL